VETPRAEFDRSVLERTGGNRSAASKQLGIHRNTLAEKDGPIQTGAQAAKKRPKLFDGAPAPRRERMDLLIFDLDGTLIDSKRTFLRRPMPRAYTGGIAASGERNGLLLCG